MSAQVAADLRAAADVLERDGWTQHKFHGQDGCHCAMGALAVAMTGSAKPNPDRWVTGGALQMRLRRALKPLEAVAGAFYIPMWNDRPGRTAAEVIAALRAAADRAEAES